MSRLIFDVGMHNGDDSEYYLSGGYKVVGIEANPILAARGAERFRDEIATGQMTIANIGVMDKTGVLPFYRSLTDDGWSTFRDDKNSKGGEWQTVEIQCDTLANLFVKYGTPYFVKIDIEGADQLAIASLSRQNAPRYVSLELTANDTILERLIDLGYSSFKLVDGESYRPAAPIWDHEIGWRLLRKLGRLVPPVREIVAALPQGMRMRSEWNPPGKFTPNGYQFGKYSSGPFGEQAAGWWLDASEALRRLTKIRNGYTKAGKEHLFWWDVHARR